MVTSTSPITSQAAREPSGFQSTVSGLRDNVLAEIDKLKALPVTKFEQQLSTLRDPCTLVSALAVAAIVTSNATESARQTGKWALVGFGVTAVLAGLNAQAPQRSNLTVDSDIEAGNSQPAAIEATATDAPNTESKVIQTYQKIVNESKLIARNAVMIGVLGRLLNSRDFREMAIGAFTATGVAYASVAFTEGKALPSLEQLQQYPQLMSAMAIMGSVLGYAAHDAKILIALPLMAALLARQGNSAVDEQASSGDNQAAVSREIVGDDFNEIYLNDAENAWGSFGNFGKEEDWSSSVSSDHQATDSLNQQTEESLQDPLKKSADLREGFKKFNETLGNNESRVSSSFHDHESEDSLAHRTFIIEQFVEGRDLAKQFAIEYGLLTNTSRERRANKSDHI